VFLGEATLSQLQTLQPFDVVIDKWWDLQPKFVMKEKQKDKIGGRVRLKLYYSMLPETRPLQTHVMDSSDIFLTRYFSTLFKTGDLILYDVCWCFVGHHQVPKEFAFQLRWFSRCFAQQMVW